MRLEDILKHKGTEVASIAPERLLVDAIALLNDRKIGALLVCSGECSRGNIAGIVTERDVLRACHARLADLGRITVGEVMTKELVIGRSDDTIDYAMAVMTRRRIRHLPVFGNGELVGMVSIGDLVNARLQDADIDIRMLHDYVHGYVSWPKTG
jgi:CBS domain-containing protein